MQTKCGCYSEPPTNLPLRLDANSIIGLRNDGVMVLGDQSNGINASRTPTKTATPTP